MKKIKILLALAMTVLAVTACGMNNSSAPSKTSDTSIENDMKNIGDAISDTADDAMDNAKKAADDLTGAKKTTSR